MLLVLEDDSEQCHTQSDMVREIRIVKEQRDECIRQLQMRGATYIRSDIRPRYMVWENVPGAFSSNKGEDFRVVLEETARIVDKDAAIPRPANGKWTPSGAVMGNGWSIAWRVHDAQWLLDTIASIKNLSQEDLDKEDELSLQAFWLRGRIGAFESIEKIIKAGMMP